MPVLATKLRMPTRRRRLVPRDRLLDQLNLDPTHAPRLVLLTAPAGYGKTTLMTQWLSSSSVAGATVAWLALDRGDADVRRFLDQLLAAIVWLLVKGFRPSPGLPGVAVSGSAGADGAVR